ncbi:MAG: cupredoxin domain-containing protein [Thermomicrobiales bacterium]
MTEPEPYTGPNHQAMNDDQAAQNAAATDETSTEIPADAATPADGTLTFDAFDMGYTVSNVSIPADTDIIFVMNNTGAAVHNWIVSEGASIDSGDAEPGTTITWVVNLPAGVYTFYCDIVGHRAAGMEGTIYVS